MKTQGYLILFFHLVFGFNYQTKLLSNVTNGWRHRHLTPKQHGVKKKKKKKNLSRVTLNYKSVKQKKWFKTVVGNHLAVSGA